MDADSWCQEMADSYFTECVGNGELMSDNERDRWIHESVDGASFSDIDDTGLIELADEGLVEHGEFSMSGNGGVREALNMLAYYAITSRINSIIAGAVDEEDLDLCDALSDSPPDDEENGCEYEGHTHIDGLMVWHLAGKREVWKHIERLGFWAEFTSTAEPTAMEELRDAVDEGAE